MTTPRASPPRASPMALPRSLSSGYRSASIPIPGRGQCYRDAVHGGHHYDANDDNVCEGDDHNAVHDGHHNDDNGDTAGKPETLEHDDPMPWSARAKNKTV